MNVQAYVAQRMVYLPTPPACQREGFVQVGNVKHYGRGTVALGVRFGWLVAVGMPACVRQYGRRSSSRCGSG